MYSKVELPEQTWTPEEAKEFVESIPTDRLVGPFAVLISGKGPVWLYCMLAHAAHACRAVAVFDPRLEGYVVVHAHYTGYHVGQVIGQNNQ